MTERMVGWVHRPDDEFPAWVDRRRVFLAPHPVDHDPFILWGEDWFGPGAFDWHAHRGFQTISYSHSGTMQHYNSLGDAGTLAAGDVLTTNAGAGLWHHAEPAGKFHGMQMWVNLPAAEKMSTPWEQAIHADDVPMIGAGGFMGRVFAGSFNGRRGPGRTDAGFISLRFEHGGLDLDFPQDHVGYLYVLEGCLDVAGKRVDAGSGARIEAGPGPLHLDAVEAGTALLATGRPIREPVVIDGDFVMNTQDEIAQAHADLAAGRMGRPMTV